MDSELCPMKICISKVDKFRLEEAAQVITEIAPEWKETAASLAGRVLSRGLDHEELTADLIIDIERAKKLEAKMKIAQRKEKAASVLTRKTPPALPPHAS